MSTEQKHFEDFMKRREEIGAAYVEGDYAPLDAIITQHGVATFFGPGGGHIHGPKHVATAYEKGAASFEPGGKSRFQILQMGADNGIGYWVGLQIATAKMKGKPEPIPMTLRITEIFRREGDDWKLVHRHADMLAEEKEKPG